MQQEIHEIRSPQVSERVSSECCVVLRHNLTANSTLSVTSHAKTLDNFHGQCHSGVFSTSSTLLPALHRVITDIFSLSVNTPRDIHTLTQNCSDRDGLPVVRLVAPGDPTAQEAPRTDQSQAVTVCTLRSQDWRLSPYWSQLPGEGWV